jgi:hypothetical protein
MCQLLMWTLPLCLCRHRKAVRQSVLVTMQQQQQQKQQKQQQRVGSSPLQWQTPA